MSISKHHIHRDEIIRFANAEHGTKVWHKRTTKAWMITSTPGWQIGTEYIVDDEFAEERKLLADKKMGTK